MVKEDTIIQTSGGQVVPRERAGHSREGEEENEPRDELYDAVPSRRWERGGRGIEITKERSDSRKGGSNQKVKH